MEASWLVLEALGGISEALEGSSMCFKSFPGLRFFGALPVHLPLQVYKIIGFPLVFKGFLEKKVAQNGMVFGIGFGSVFGSILDALGGSWKGLGGVLEVLGGSWRRLGGS